MCRKTLDTWEDVSSLPNNPYALHMIKLVAPGDGSSSDDRPQCPVCGDRFPVNEIEVVMDHCQLSFVLIQTIVVIQFQAHADECCSAEAQAEEATVRLAETAPQRYQFLPLSIQYNVLN